MRRLTENQKRLFRQLEEAYGCPYPSIHVGDHSVNFVSGPIEWCVNKFGGCFQDVDSTTLHFTEDIYEAWQASRDIREAITPEIVDLVSRILEDK